jgi:pimeloyl-[acyl-carrier protein] methyl ester esterase
MGLSRHGSIKPETRATRLSDGASIHVRVAGEGRPLMLVHGWAMSGAAFFPQFALAAHGFRVVAPDLRGFGDSERGAAPLSIARFAEDLGELAEALDLEEAILIGWSMGAAIGWDALANGRAAGRFAGMIGVDMSPAVLNTPDWNLGLANGHDATANARTLDSIAADWPAHCEAFVGRVFAPDRPGDDPLRATLSAIARATVPGHAREAWRHLAAHDGRTALGRVTIPVCMAHGAKSQLYRPAVAQWLVEALPNAHRHVFERSGHAPHLEEPYDFNALVIRFAHGLRGGRPASTPATPLQTKGT